MRIFALTTVGFFALGGLSAPVWGESDIRSVQVGGIGEVHAEPDRAMVTLGIESRKPTLEAARNDVTRGIEAILKLTRDFKIDSKDVRTTRLVVQPEYDWNNTSRERKLIGYYVSRQAEIMLRDLEQLGLLLERSVSLGANSIGDPRLESSRQHELEREALALAIDDARLNAEAVAKAAKATVGPVRTIDSSVAYAPPPVPLQMNVMSVRAKSDTDRAATYQLGQLSFSASVRVQYDLLVK